MRFLIPALTALFAATLLVPGAAALALEVTAHDDGIDFWFTIAGYPGKNPTLSIPAGTVVNVTLHNEGTAKHNFHVDGVAGGIPCCIAVGATEKGTFTMPNQPVQYYCEPHRTLGMQGQLIPMQQSTDGTTSTGKGMPAPGVASALLVLAFVITRRRRTPLP